MFDTNKIKLSSAEAAAYWWVNKIKSKVREIVIQGTRNKQEFRFAKIFAFYTDVEWRNFYLRLVNFIQEEVKKYPESNFYDFNQFHQETSIGGHRLINKVLFKFSKHIIPDISLAANGTEDEVVYTSVDGTGVLHLSCGVIALPDLYDNDYILTGDKKLLYFQNLLKAIIVILSQKAGGFHSTTALRDGFCEECNLFYVPNEDVEKIKELFDFVFNKLSSDNLILGQSSQEKYFSDLRDIDCIGLEPYMEEAEEFVKTILKKYQDEVGKPRILKKPEV